MRTRFEGRAVGGSNSHSRLSSTQRWHGCSPEHFACRCCWYRVSARLRYQTPPDSAGWDALSRTRKSDKLGNGRILHQPIEPFLRKK